MKVILLEEIKNLGKKGDVRDVSRGYFINCLLPQNKAELATDEAVKKMELKRDEAKRHEAEDEKKLEDKKDALKKIKIVIKKKSEKGKLFGAINAKEIAEAIAKKGIEINEKSIFTHGPIKNIGPYEIKVTLGKNKESKIKIWIEEA